MRLPVLALAAALLMEAATVRAATTFTATTATNGNWNAAASWVGGVIPSGAGNIAVLGAAGVTRTLNVATTLGQIKNTQGSGRLFSIAASGTIAMTMDNTGGTTNVAGDSNSFIGSTSSGAIDFDPNIIIQNTDLDIYQNGSTQPSGTYGTLGSSTITATSARNLILLQNYTGGKAITINHSIGSSGSVITVQNKGLGDANPGAVLAGVVGPNAAVVQNSHTSSLKLSAANTYTGKTTITAGTLILSGSLSASSSISIAAGATFDVSALATYTLGSSATLSASGNASAATIKGGTTVNLGSRPVSLTFNGTNPALTLSAGTLQLNNNTFTVIVPGAALGAGTYTLVTTPEAITGSPNATPSFTGGNGIVSGATATVGKSGNNIVLTVTAGGPVVVQSETGTFDATSVVETVNAGWTGTGYINTGNAVGSFSEVTVNVASAGNYQVDFRFANGSSASRPADFIVNGTVVQAAVAFPATGSWTNWSDLTLTATLKAGANTVRVSSTTTAGTANMDKVTVSPAAATTVDATHSTISPGLAALTANGGSKQVITVQARSTSDSNITTGGATVVFSRTGTGTLSGTTDNGNGTYTATLTAPTSVGSATITATLNGTAVGTAVSASQCAVTYYSTNAGDPLPGLTSAELAAFTAGSATFGASETESTGLGPIFNNSGCANCHADPVAGGAGSAHVTRFGLNSGGTFNPLTSLGGSLLQDNSTTTNFETVPASANVVIQRETQPCFGIGLIEAIPDSIIQSNAAVANADGIVGTVALVTDPISNQQRVGRFGWKAQLPTLLAFTADAANNEIGITSRIFPVGQSPNGNTNLYKQLNTVADPNDVVVNGKANVDRSTDFQRLLSPPPTLPLTANATAGKTLFSQIRCDACHTPVLFTGPNFKPVSDLSTVSNAVIAALSNKAVPLYSDLLLHNMGTLADGIAQGAAKTNQMRTAPLWGARLSLPYLHDGRALTLDAAIRAHAGDAAASATRYINLTTTQQSQLVEFLNSL